MTLVEATRANAVAPPARATPAEIVGTYRDALERVSRCRCLRREGYPA